MSIIRAINDAVFEWRRDRFNGAVKAIYLGEFDYNDFCSEVTPDQAGYDASGQLKYRGVPVYRVNTKRHLAVN